MTHGRRGVPPAGPCGEMCDMKAKLDDLYDRTINSYSKLNGQPADFSNDLKIEGSSNVRITQTGGNTIKIETVEDLDSLDARAPLSYDPAENKLTLMMDTQPVASSIKPVTSDGIKMVLDVMQHEIHSQWGNIDNNTANIAGLNTRVGAAESQITGHGSRLDAAEQNIENTADDVADIIDGTAQVGRAVTQDSAGTAGSASQVPASGVSGVLAIEHGGTGSGTKNFVDLTTDQTIDGIKIMRKVRLQSTQITTPSGYPSSSQWGSECVFTAADGGVCGGLNLEYASVSTNAILRVINGANTARLLLRLYADGHATVQLDKTTGGVYSSTIVGALQ